MEYAESFQSFDEVEIRIFQEGDSSPGSTNIGDLRFYAELTLMNGYTFSNYLPPLPEKKGSEIENPRAIGTELFQWLFQSGSELEKGFFHARWQSEAIQGLRSAGKGKIRLRLWVDPRSEVLHGLWWEAMYDPARDTPVALTMALSRFVRDEIPKTWPVAERPLRMLFITSNPQGVEKFGCAPMDTQFEQRLVYESTSRLARSLETMPLLGNPSIAAIRGKLEEVNAHIIYLLANVGYAGDEAVLLFSDEQGSVVPTKFSEVAQLLVPSPRQAPHLVFLALPSTAPIDSNRTLARLGQILVDAGAQASVAIQRQIPKEMIVDFSSHFFDALARGGVIDAAMMSARERIYQPDSFAWAFPVLYMRTSDAILFQPLSAELEEGLRLFSSKFTKRAR